MKVKRLEERSMLMRTTHTYLAKKAPFILKMANSFIFVLIVINTLRLLS